MSKKNKSLLLLALISQSDSLQLDTGKINTTGTQYAIPATAETAKASSSLIPEVEMIGTKGVDGKITKIKQSPEGGNAVFGFSQSVENYYVETFILDAKEAVEGHAFQVLVSLNNASGETVNGGTKEHYGLDNNWTEGQVLVVQINGNTYELKMRKGFNALLMNIEGKNQSVESIRHVWDNEKYSSFFSENKSFGDSSPAEQFLNLVRSMAKIMETRTADLIKTINATIAAAAAAGAGAGVAAAADGAFTALNPDQKKAIYIAGLNAYAAALAAAPAPAPAPVAAALTAGITAAFPAAPGVGVVADIANVIIAAIHNSGLKKAAFGATLTGKLNAAAPKSANINEIDAALLAKINMDSRFADTVPAQMSSAEQRTIASDLTGLPSSLFSIKEVADAAAGYVAGDTLVELQTMLAETFGFRITNAAGAITAVTLGDKSAMLSSAVPPAVETDVLRAWGKLTGVSAFDNLTVFSRFAAFLQMNSKVLNEMPIKLVAGVGGAPATLEWNFQVGKTTVDMNTTWSDLFIQSSANTNVTPANKLSSDISALSANAFYLRSMGVETDKPTLDKLFDNAAAKTFETFNSRYPVGMHAVVKGKTAADDFVLKTEADLVKIMTEGLSSEILLSSGKIDLITRTQLDAISSVLKANELTDFADVKNSPFAITIDGKGVAATVSFQGTDLKRAATIDSDDILLIRDHTGMWSILSAEIPGVSITLTANRTTNTVPYNLATTSDKVLLQDTTLKALLERITKAIEADTMPESEELTKQRGIVASFEQLIADGIVGLDTQLADAKAKVIQLTENSAEYAAQVIELSKLYDIDYKTASALIAYINQAKADAVKNTEKDVIAKMTAAADKAAADKAAADKAAADKAKAAAAAEAKAVAGDDDLGVALEGTTTPADSKSTAIVPTGTKAPTPAGTKQTPAPVPAGTKTTTKVDAKLTTVTPTPATTKTGSDMYTNVLSVKEGLYSVTITYTDGTVIVVRNDIKNVAAKARAAIKPTNSSTPATSAAV